MPSLVTSKRVSWTRCLWRSFTWRLHECQGPRAGRIGFLSGDPWMRLINIYSTILSLSLSLSLSPSLFLCHHHHLHPILRSSIPALLTLTLPSFHPLLFSLQMADATTTGIHPPSPLQLAAREYVAQLLSSTSGYEDDTDTDSDSDVDLDDIDHRMSCLSSTPPPPPSSSSSPPPVPSRSPPEAPSAWSHPTSSSTATTARNTEKLEGPVIPFQSQCEHHMLPFTGVVR